MEEEKLKKININYELFILAVSVLSVLNLFLLWLPIEPLVKEVIHIIDLFLTPIFILDFLKRLFSAEKKSQYFLHEYGWLDLLGSLPFPNARIFRLLRIVKAAKIMRKYGFAKIRKYAGENGADTAIYAVLFLIIVVLEFGGMFVLAVESKVDTSNIKTASDALWWGYVTITTVGYGDRFPVTNEGRIVGVMLLTVGVGLFGVFTGFLANTFLAPKKRKKKDGEPEEDVIDVVKEIRQLVNLQEKEIKTLKDKITKIESGNQ